MSVGQMPGGHLSCTFVVDVSVGVARTWRRKDCRDDATTDRRPQRVRHARLSLTTVVWLSRTRTAADDAHWVCALTRLRSAISSGPHRLASAAPQPIVLRQRPEMLRERSRRYRTKHNHCFFTPSSLIVNDMDLECEKYGCVLFCLWSAVSKSRGFCLLY